MTPKEISTMAKNAAVYLRRSTDRQEQSIGDQRAAIERYAVENGFTIVREYIDDAISGADTEARKAFLAMIEDAKTRDAPFRYVLVYDVSRFGRTGADEAGFFRHTLAQAGIEVIYVAEALTGTDADDLLLATKQWLAHRMVVDLSKVTLRGQLSRVGKGRWCGGRPPYGYDLVYFDSTDRPYQIIRFLDTGEREVRGMDGTVQRVIPRGDELSRANGEKAILIPGDPARVAVIQRIFDLYVNAGLGLGGIADRLNQDGIPSAMGHRPGTRWRGTWSSGTIREILRNPAYRGAMAWNRISYAKFHTVKGGHAVQKPKAALGKVHRNSEADWVIVEDTHEPLVPREVFERAQRLMKTRGGTIGDAVRASRRNSPYALAGLIRCARCGARWQGYKTRKGRKKEGERPIETLYYCCGGYIAKGNAVCGRALVGKDEFEKVVLDGVRDHLHAFITTGGAGLLEALVVEAASPGGDREPALRERLADRRRKLDELIGCLTPALRETLEPRIVALRDEIAGIEADLAEARRVRLDAAHATALVAELVHDAGRIGALLETATASDTRDLLRAIVQEVVIDPEKGEGTIGFHAIPKMPAEAGGPGHGPAEAGGPDGRRTSREPGNDKRTPPLDARMSSYIQMAGAGFEPATSGL